MIGTESFFIRNLWRDFSGLPEEEWVIPTKNIHETEWSNEFEMLMRNRLIVGGLRYGKIKDSNIPLFSNIDYAISKLNKFKSTGNKECLVDAANLCLVEFETTKHPNANWNALDDTEHKIVI